jgi:hypothetical protein
MEMINVQIAGVVLSVFTLTASAINIYVGLRLAVIQARLKADSAALEVSLVKQFVGWKEDVVRAINDKYVTGALVAEMRSNFRDDLGRIDKRLERIEERCAERLEKCQPGGRHNVE